MILANHQIIDFYKCDKDILSNSSLVKSYFVKSAELANATISIHTWPEYGYAAIDVFSCCDKLDHKRLVENLKGSLKAGKVKSKSIKRGRL